MIKESWIYQNNTKSNHYEKNESDICNDCICCDSLCSRSDTKDIFLDKLRT